MNAGENPLELNGSATDVTVDNLSDSAPENNSESPSGTKKGPPVAPKPAWFRQSLRKIGEDHKMQALPAEQRRAVAFNKRFGIRSASTATSLSIKQKIHSFETFSSPETPENGDARRTVAPCSSLPLMEKEPKSRLSPSKEYGRNNNNPPREQQPTSAAEDNTQTSASPAAVNSSNLTEDSFSERAPSSTQSPIDPPPTETNNTLPESATKDSNSAPVHSVVDVGPTKAEDNVDSSRSEESDVSPAAVLTTVRSSQAEEEMSPEKTEEERAESQRRRVSQPPGVVLSNDGNCVQSLEEESLGRILVFSNQVFCWFEHQTGTTTIKYSILMCRLCSRCPMR